MAPKPRRSGAARLGQKAKASRARQSASAALASARARAAAIPALFAPRSPSQRIPAPLAPMRPAQRGSRGPRARAAAIPAPLAPRRPAQRGGRGRAVRQRVGPAGRGDESDSEDSLILDLAGGDDGDAGHPGSGDEGAGGDAALHGQPVGAMAQVGALRVRVRIMLGGRAAPGVHPGQGGGHCGRAAVDSPPLK